MLDPEVATFGLWLEQLVAESLGKDGTGARARWSASRSVPPEVYGDDRLFLAQVPIDDLEAAGHPALVGGSDASPHGIGHMVVTIELATALAGAAIGVQPFDQPDVAAAKAATTEVLDERRQPRAARSRSATSSAASRPATTSRSRRSSTRAATTAARARGRARVALRDQLPRGRQPRLRPALPALHGPAPQGRAAGDRVRPGARATTPTRSRSPAGRFGFGDLKPAQAAGDLQALQDRGRIRPAASTSPSCWRWP